MTKQTFLIRGMSCTGCERTLERAISRLKGVSSVKADYTRQELCVSYEEPCRSEHIRAAVEAAGYQVAEQPQQDSSALYILIILTGLFIIARQLGWTEFFQSFPVAGAEQVGYVVLFFIGLLTSVHCIAMCGGINLTQSVTGSASHPLRRSLLYNLGRLTSYTLIGGILGLVGSAAAISLKVRGIIGLAAGCFMVLMGINMLGHFGFFRRLSLRLPVPLARALSSFAKHGPFAIGLVNGFMPCGPLQSMQIYAIASGSFLSGALSMFFFCLGTIPLVLLFGAAAGALRLSWKDRMLKVSSCLLVLLGLFMVQNNLALSGVSFPCMSMSQASETVAASVEGDTQYITTHLRANGYEDIQVTAGIPVVWTIIAEEEDLNGCNNELVIPAFDQQIKLTEGSNVISFTPEEAGTYSYSCWMGMLRNTITVTDA